MDSDIESVDSSDCASVEEAFHKEPSNVSSQKLRKSHGSAMPIYKEKSNVSSHKSDSVGP